MAMKRQPTLNWYEKAEHGAQPLKDARMGTTAVGECLKIGATWAEDPFNLAWELLKRRRGFSNGSRVSSGAVDVPTKLQ